MTAACLLASSLSKTHPSLLVSDMLARALPEGVLQPGSRVSGFLYFEGVGAGVKQVRLIAEFPNPQCGAPVARLAIPFVVG